MSSICPVCGCSATVVPQGPLMLETAITCPVCGVFVITEVAEDEMNRDEVAAWLYYHANYDEKQERYTSAWFISKDNQGKDDERYVTLDEISNWYPKSFNERISAILLGLANKTKFLGNYTKLSREQLISAFFITRFDEDSNPISEGVIRSQLTDMMDYLEKSKLIEYGSNVKDRFPVKLLVDGWQRVDELQKHNSNNRDVFIAMSFNSKNDRTKEAIKDGIIKAGYVPRIMSEEIHGKQIVPMMFHIIRECKLLVMDVTDQNLGAYHEAGYALGLGKEVIITCKKEEFDNPDNKPHFDIVQRQILIWNDYEDLAFRLSEWIKAIAG